jgi:hypothetical protein
VGPSPAYTVLPSGAIVRFAAARLTTGDEHRALSCALMQPRLRTAPVAGSRSSVSTSSSLCSRAVRPSGEKVRRPPADAFVVTRVHFFG